VIVVGNDELIPLSPRECREEYLNHRRLDLAESTISSHFYRLKHFLKWCDEEQIDNLNDLTGRDIHQYERHRRGDGLEATSLKSELNTLRKYLEFAARLDAVPPELPDKVDPPTPSKREEVSEEKLPADRALRLLEHLREQRYGTRDHVLLELAWNTGARAGALAGLDVSDYDSEEQYVEFRHRPDLDTPLKNQYEGERPVSLSDCVCDAIDAYLYGDDRRDVRDDHGRHPLLTSLTGRPTSGTVRDWMYQITRPCEFEECPHDRDPEDCEAMEHGRASKCPSSRSPHPVRSGSISWQLSCGIPLELVEARVDASREVILRHYDLRGARAKMEQRRDHIIPNLSYS